MSVRTILFLLLCAPFFVSCDYKTVLEKGLEQKIESATGKKSQVNISKEKVTVEFDNHKFELGKRADGSVHMLSLPESVRVEKSISGPDINIVSLSSDSSVEKTVADISALLLSNGYTESKSLLTEGLYSGRFVLNEKKGIPVLVMAFTRGNGDKTLTHVVITYPAKRE